MERLTHCLICGAREVQNRRHGAYYRSIACKQRAYRIRRGRAYSRLSPAEIEQRRQAGAASAEAKARRQVEHAIAVFARLERRSER
jgi:hypothetical protein